MKNIPDPNKVFPNEKLPALCYIKNVVKNPNIIIGDYTYYYGDDADQFEKHVTHHYPFIGDKLIIGKFCAIAQGLYVFNTAKTPRGLFSAQIPNSTISKIFKN